MGQLITGLPDEIAMECLVRVPYRFHWNMKWVSRDWRTLISHPSFYRERRKLGKAEHLVCLVQALPTPSPPPPVVPPLPDSGADYCFNKNAKVSSDTKKHHHPHHIHDGEGKDKTEKQQLHRPPLYGLSVYNVTSQAWHRMMPNCGFDNGFGVIPMFCHCVALPSVGKVILLGGWNPTTFEPLPDVYIIDLMGGRGGAWFRRAAPMSVARSFFGCAAVGPATVYVAGGHDSQKNALRSAEVYDVNTDEWTTLPDMAEERDECGGLCWEEDSKFWAVSGYSTERQGRFRSDAEFYDPSAGAWTTIDGVWPFPSISPRGTTATTVRVGGQNRQWWWFLGGEQQQQNGEVKEYDSKEENWKVVNSIPLPDSIVGSSPCVAALGGGVEDKIFVMGGGGRGSSLSSSCEAFAMERDRKSNKYKWNHILTPPSFTGFPFSASHLVI